MEQTWGADMGVTGGFGGSGVVGGGGGGVGVGVRVGAGGGFT